MMGTSIARLVLVNLSEPWVALEFDTVSPDPSDIQQISYFDDWVSLDQKQIRFQTWRQSATIRKSKFICYETRHAFKNFDSRHTSLAGQEFHFKM